MKILAIRGKNLASLYGEFELPLDVGPIAHAGLFSVSGPTGAGKSTLVDALCLPLYNETPRFDARGGGVRPGRLDDDPGVLVDANDKRNLLSRGTAEGYAEVDFEAVDGKRYRARWSVWRARKRPDGRFQAAEMTLQDLDAGTPVCAGVDEVRKRVQALVGYSFAEFRRAVVLPQFEFRAFLDADTDTRARILERVTGTELYARISQKAHERAAAERASLAELEARAAGLAVLAPEERSAEVQRAKGLEQQGERARAEKEAAAAEARWHQEEAKLVQDVSDAELAVARADAALQAAEDRRAELAAVEGVQPLRALRDESSRTAAEHRAALTRREAAASALATAAGERDSAERMHRAADGALQSCLDGLDASRPDLDRARALDVRIGELSPRVARAEADLEAARRDVASRQAELAAAERKHAGAERLRAAAEAWLAAREAERALAADWPRWQKRLAEHADLVRELRRAEASLQRSASRLDDVTARHHQLASSFAEQKAAFGQLESSAAEAMRLAAGDDLVALAARLKAAVASRDQLARLRALAGEAQAAVTARQAAAEELHSARAKLARLGDEQQAAGERMIAAEARVGAAREALARIDAALSLEERRAALVEGEPCPLCGAQEHPYAKDAPAQSARVAQAAAVRDADQALEQLRREAESRAGELAAAGERARGAADAERRHAAALADAEARYAAARLAAAGSEVPAAAATAGEVLAGLAAGALEGVARAEEHQAGALGRKSAAEGARAAVDRARGALETVQASLGAAELEREIAAGDARAAGEAVRGLVARRDGAEADLEPALGFAQGWRERARTSPEELVTACATVARSHAEQEQSLRDATEALAALGPEREALRTSLAEKEQRAIQADAVARAERGSLGAVRTEREGLLAGEPVARVESRRVAAERSARAALDTASKGLRDADLGLKGGQVALEAANVAMARAELEATGAAATLASALVARGLDRARLDALLERAAPWISGEREALAALADALRDERARRDERRRKLEVHGAGRPASTLEEARARAAAAMDAEQEALRDLTAVRARLLDDERKSQARGALEVELDRQRAMSERWGALATLIGSHDGRELRVFAQGLALDALLRAANHHLANLAPRYVLQRVPRRDLDLQVVDGDLGNEVRGVNGLSGGESFLVSLALALGLSSLSTSRTQSRTLFIDEGFGTLDRDTLEQAMAAIDQLGSGDRTVGVISHVPELHERIGVKVTIERVSAGRSRLVLPEGTPIGVGGAAAPRRAS